jgi:hypothetical protein
MPDTDPTCCPCANGQHDRCWERRGISFCGDVCFTADAALRAALSSKELLKGTLRLRDALLGTLRQVVDEADGDSLNAEQVQAMREALNGRYLVPPVELAAMADEIESVLRDVPVRLGPNALAILREDGTVPLSGGEYAAMALAVATMLAEADPDA